MKVQESMIIKLRKSNRWRESRTDKSGTSDSLMYNGGMNKYCTFYIVRHGETVWNVQGRLQGHKNSPLTERGLKQATNVGKKLKNIDFDVVFSSDLLRTKRTAELIVLEKKMAINTTTLLRERSFGKFEGKNGTAVFRGELKKDLATFLKLSDEQKKKFKYPTTESDEEVVSRYLTFLRETAVAYPGKKVLVVSHGGAMKALLIHLGFGTYDELTNKSVANTSYIELESDGVDFFIKDTVGIHKFPA